MHKGDIRICDGKLFIKGKEYRGTYLVFIKEIARGANGIVYLAHDPVLQRNVAFKIWLKLRPNDIRDKIKQGTEEARKLIKAKNKVDNYHDPKLDNLYFISDRNDITNNIHHIVCNVFFTGEQNGFFYAVMEYISGETLRSLVENRKYQSAKDVTLHLASKDLVHVASKDLVYVLPFGVRFKIASDLIRYNQIFIDNLTNHGDLHSNNIMIYDMQLKKDYIKTLYNYKIKILDFGTSYFSNTERSVNRSFQTLVSTINECLYPFDVNNIFASKKPRDYNKMTSWINQQLHAIRAGFFELGQEYVGWPFYPQFGTYKLTTEGFGIDLSVIKSLIYKYVEEDKLSLSEEFLGISKNWDFFDGRYAKRGD